MVPWREKVLWLEIFKTRQDQPEYKGAWDQLLAGAVWRSKSWAGMHLISQIFFH